MTNLPQPSPNEYPSRKRAGGLGLISILLLVASGLFYLHSKNFPQKQISSLLNSQLSSLLNRPVKVGNLQGLSLNHLDFGSSQILPTKKDPDRITASKIVVNFNLLHFFLTRELDIGIKAISPVVYFEQASNGDWLRTPLNLPPADNSAFIKFQLNEIKLEDARITLRARDLKKGLNSAFYLLVNKGKLEIDPVTQSKLDYQVEGVLGGSGNLAIFGKTNLPDLKTSIAVSGTNLPAVELSKLFPLPISFLHGKIMPNLKLIYSPKLPIVFSGRAVFSQINIQSVALKQSLNNIEGSVSFASSNIHINNSIRADLGKIKTRTSGNLDLFKGYKLNIKIQPFKLTEALETLNLKAPSLLLQGRAKADIELKGALNKPEFLLQLRPDKEVILVDKIPFRDFGFKAKLDGNYLKLKQFQGLPTIGGKLEGSGQALIAPTNKFAFIFNFAGKQIPLAPLTWLYHLQLPAKIGLINFQGLIKGQQGKSNELKLTGKLQTHLASGQINLDNFNYESKFGHWQASLSANDLPIGEFLPSLKVPIEPVLNSQIIASGSFQNLAKTLKAKGYGILSWQKGSFLDGPLSTSFVWSANRLDIQKFSTPNLDTRGWLQIDPYALNKGVAALGEVFLDIKAGNLNLHKIALPSQLAKVDHQGFLDFIGRLRGTIKEPYLEGKLALTEAILGPLTIEKILTGSLNISPEAGLNLNLNGHKDSIALALDKKYQLQKLKLQLEPLNLSAKKNQNQLDLQIKYLSIAWLKHLLPYTPFSVPSYLKSASIGGDLSGNFKVNLAKNELITDSLEINNPLFGPLKGTQFNGFVNFINGNLTLSKGMFKSNQTIFELDGLLKTRESMAYRANLKIIHGKIQNLLQSLQVFEYSDLLHGFGEIKFAKAKDLYLHNQSTNQPLFDFGKLNSTVQYQLRRFSEIKTLSEIEKQKNNQIFTIPALSKLSGNFDAQVQVSGSLKNSINTRFDFSAQDWQWDNLKIKEIAASGEWQKDRFLRIDSIIARQGNVLLSVSGGLSDSRLNAKVQLEKIPISSLLSLANLQSPDLNIGGTLNANLFVEGSKDNPKATGDIEIANALVNQVPLESTQANFSYNNSILQFFASSLVAPKAPPVTLQGNFPYKLPFAKKEPNSPDFNVVLNISNDSFKILNILSKDQLHWLGGKASADLWLKGTFDSDLQQITQMKSDGLITVEDGSIEAKLIPDEPLTDINGKIALNFDQVDVKELNAKFSGSSISVVGSLPLNRSSISVAQPLVADFGGVSFDLNGLYKGGLKGKLIVTGSALYPHLGGNIDLFKGKILLGALSKGGTQSTSEYPKFQRTALVFENLKLNLKDDVQLVQYPLLWFVAKGNLTLNGTLDQPRPEGTINLSNGLINLFTASFRLNRANRNIARFTPEHGLDPYLYVNLATSATETERSLLRSDNLSSEINTPFTANFEGLQTVRIEAKVAGFASDLDRSIQLSSTPARNPIEIINLLSGGGDPTIGLANFAGNALFGKFQENVRSIFGFSEFRIFPAQVLTNPSNSRTAVFSQTGIAAEVGIDLSPKLFFSAQQLLNVQYPTQFGFRYRINNNWVFRGSSNFSNDSRALLQYDVRF